VIGNAGSFFKNPVVSVQAFDALRSEYPSIPGYPSGDGIKLAAGWLIEQAGFKGIRRGDAGVHTKQALVLVNYGHAAGKDIYDLSEEIIDVIKKRFHVVLQREVNILPENE
jgi:UDP-N-acetylmuramate dehydrogenase